MPVTKKILGHRWNDKLLCLGAVLLKLERPSASPGGLVETQAAGPACRAPDSAGVDVIQVVLMPLVWGPLLKGLKVTERGEPGAEGNICQLEALSLGITDAMSHQATWRPQEQSALGKIRGNYFLSILHDSELSGHT